MTKMRAVGVPQQGLHKPGGPSVAHHTRESRTMVGTRAAGSHGARAAQIGGGKPPTEVSTLRQRPLGSQHGHGDHGAHDGGSGPQRGGPPDPPASRTGRQLDRQGQGPTQSRSRKGDHGRDASLPVAMEPLGRQSSTENENRPMDADSKRDPISLRPYCSAESVRTHKVASKMMMSLRSSTLIRRRIKGAITSSDSFMSFDGTGIRRFPSKQSARMAGTLSKLGCLC
ncbi:unnamed protein product [Phytophthora fragariaefolia]|uniref:Unnamed protein product n=1 Tax=Phytophthora fragariaefolia TaxID=1490495 RepID=A0A9W6XVL9_9STRA|nr:unnamed protein product [Phytophthora fragariaefolia]